MILTGGLYSKSIVSVYNDDGWIQDLASLKTGRYDHSCGQYTSNNELVKNLKIDWVNNMTAARLISGIFKKQNFLHFVHKETQL